MVGGGSGVGKGSDTGGGGGCTGRASGAGGEPLGAEPAALGSDGITALPSAGPDRTGHWSRISRLTSAVRSDTTRQG